MHFSKSRTVETIDPAEHVRQVVVAANELVVLPLPSLRAIFDDRAGVAVARRVHPERLEDALGDELPVTLCRHLLDEVTEKAVVEARGGSPAPIKAALPMRSRSIRMRTGLLVLIDQAEGTRVRVIAATDHWLPEVVAERFETSLANSKHGAKAQAAAAAALRRYKQYICKGCGIRFKARSFEAQLCSTKCGERYRHKSKPRICKRCGTEFWRGTATSCGPCSKQFIRRVCEWCSKPCPWGWMERLGRPSLVQNQSN